MRHLVACNKIRRLGVEPRKLASCAAGARWQSSTTRNRSLFSVISQFNAEHNVEKDGRDENYQWGTTIGNANFHTARVAAARRHDATEGPSLNPNEILDHIHNLTQPSDVHASPEDLCYFGKSRIPITSDLHLVTPEEDTPAGIWPVFRMMDENGRLRHDSGLATKKFPSQDLEALRSHLVGRHPKFASELSNSALLCEAKHEYTDVPTRNTLLRAYRNMVRLREMDGILLNAQRQGRISFYMTCTGEEAIHFGAASALDLADTVFAQYREAGLLMWRGFTLEQFTNQCFSNDLDLGKGRQMPIHYGSRALNYQTISSPLGTQLPQAVGAAYHMKLQKKDSVCVAFFGDGSASSTDFHAACNFASTLRTPTIFFCRNNGFAISTPTDEQYAGDGIVSRAPGYGMAAIRVDGNDLFAVHAATRQAKKYALERSAPVMIEAITYRAGHHSTSDDSTRYRDNVEIGGTHAKADPVKRLEAFLDGIGWLGDEEKSNIRDEEKMSVLAAIEAAEKRTGPSLSALFEDVYCDVPPQLQEQETALQQHLGRQAKH